MWGMRRSVYAPGSADVSSATLNHASVNSGRDARAPRSGGRPVALLVFFSAAAPAGVVAADLWFLALDLDRAGRAAGAGEDHCGRFLFRGRHGALHALDVFPFAFAFDDHLRFPEVLDHAVLDQLHHFLEDLVRLLFVLDELIALAVAAQADAFLEVIDIEQVVLPELIDHLQEDVLLVQAHHLRADRRFLLLVAPIDGFDHTVLHRRGRRRGQIDTGGFQIDAETVVELR